ncbi:MAG: hypothetical protein HYU79_03475 [Nitrosomonadales bacterium]|nr:hypothetical protein [Nitrosomonadales bacterium]
MAFWLRPMAGSRWCCIFFQARMVFYPGIGREIIATPGQAGLPYGDIRLTTSDAT